MFKTKAGHAEMAAAIVEQANDLVQEEMSEDTELVYL